MFESSPVFAAAWIADRTLLALTDADALTDPHALNDAYALHRSTDLGRRWQQIGTVPRPHPLPGQIIGSEYDYFGWPRLREFPGTENGLLVDAELGLMRSFDGGRSWSLSRPGRSLLLLVEGSPEPELLRVESVSGVVYLIRSGDQGASWESLAQLPRLSPFDFARDGADSNILYLCGHCGLPIAGHLRACLFVSHDSGMTWSEVPSLGGTTGPVGLLTQAGVPGVLAHFRSVAFQPPEPEFVGRIGPKGLISRVFETGDLIGPFALAAYRGQAHLLVSTFNQTPAMRVVREDSVDTAQGLDDQIVIRLSTNPDDPAQVLAIDTLGRLSVSNDGGLSWRSVSVANGLGAEPVAVPALGPIALVVLALAMVAMARRSSARPR